MWKKRKVDEITDVFEQKVDGWIVKNNGWKSHTDCVWHGRVNPLFSSVSGTNLHLVVTLTINPTLNSTLTLSVTLSRQLTHRGVHMTVIFVVGHRRLYDVIIVRWRHEVLIAWRQREVDDVKVDSLSGLYDDDPRTVVSAVSRVMDRSAGQMSLKVAEQSRVWTSWTWAARKLIAQICLTTDKRSATSTTWWHCRNKKSNINI